MFRKRNPRPASDDDQAGLGIGALVRVVEVHGGEQWADEPLGVIVGTGGNGISGWSGVGVSVSWTVAFDTPAYTKDGRGPFERATVLGRQLVAVEPTPEP